MLPTLRPKALRASDLVAVASLSGGLEESEASLLERGVETIEQMGLAVRVSPLVDLDRRWWWAAAPPREVAEEFNGLLADPQVRAIFSLTGGRMALSYLDLIDLEAIRRILSRCWGSATSPCCTSRCMRAQAWCACTPTSSRTDSGIGMSATRPAASNSRTSIFVC